MHSSGGNRFTNGLEKKSAANAIVWAANGEKERSQVDMGVYRSHNTNGHSEHWNNLIVTARSINNGEIDTNGDINGINVTAFETTQLGKFSRLIQLGNVMQMLNLSPINRFSKSV